MNEDTSSSFSLKVEPSIPPVKLDRSQISFYQRQLPDDCIPFTSDPGKSLFRQALDSGHLEAFFPLSSQLVTQHEPSFCGLASLCTVLNALGVDPRRVWKHPWRWYEQDMLDCCRPLEAVQRVGITLSEFNCLARCNGLRVYSSSPLLSDKSNPSFGISLEQFRNQIKASTNTSSSFMVVSFSRSALGQTGSGHFSPIAGYDPTTDRVLVLDVARFKYPSYWVRLEDLYNAMRPLDSATGLPRGFSVLS
ncbi:Phytochelatin synthase, partial [Melampsora americana]